MRLYARQCGLFAVLILVASCVGQSSPNGGGRVPTLPVDRVASREQAVAATYANCVSANGGGEIAVQIFVSSIDGIPMMLKTSTEVLTRHHAPCWAAIGGAPSIVADPTSWNHPTGCSPDGPKDARTGVPIC